MAMATGRVEVGDAIRRLVADADPLQVLFDHETGPLPLDPEEQFVRPKITHPLTHHADDTARCTGSVSLRRCFEQAASTTSVGWASSRRKLRGVRLPNSGCE